MVKKKLINDIKNDPARFYRVPGDVIRDRRFRDDERMEILKAWESASQDDVESAPPVLQQVMEAKKELERRSDTSSHD